MNLEKQKEIALKFQDIEEKKEDLSEEDRLKWSSYNTHQNHQSINKSNKFLCSFKSLSTHLFDFLIFNSKCRYNINYKIYNS